MKHTPRVLMQFVLLYVAVSGPAYACLQSPGYGFIIHSYLKDETRVFTVYTNQVGQSLHGEWLSDNGYAIGYGGPFDGIADGSGNLAELGARTPARWRIKDVNGFCSQYDPRSHPSTQITRTLISSQARRHSLTSASDMPSR